MLTEFCWECQLGNVRLTKNLHLLKRRGGYYPPVLFKSAIFPNKQFFQIKNIAKSKMLPNNISKSTIFPKQQYFQINNISKSTIFLNQKYFQIKNIPKSQNISNFAITIATIFLYLYFYSKKAQNFANSH